MDYLAARSPRERLLLGAGALLVIGISLWLLLFPAAPPLLPLAEGDAVESWNFKGAYTNNPELEQRGKDEIARIEGMLGKDGEIPDYSLYVGIAQQYDLLGDGKKVREYLEKALAIDSASTGLAWMNMGALFEKLGALQTARTAYAKAVEAQPAGMEFHVARLTFLIEHFGGDTAAIEGAFSEAAREFGEAAAFFQLRAQWMSEVGRYAEAIAAWKKVKVFMPPGQDAAIDREIARLEAKL